MKEFVVVQKLRVILGAGKTTSDGWIATQEDELNLLSKQDWMNRFERKSIDAKKPLVIQVK